MSKVEMALEREFGDKLKGELAKGIEPEE